MFLDKILICKLTIIDLKTNLNGFDYTIRRWKFIFPRIKRSTSTEFKVRFRNHKSSMLKNRRTCELAVHYNSFEHQICQISFIIIEQIENHKNATHLEQLLLTREAYWTSQLFSLYPHGLNKRREFKSKNRICYNS